MILVFAGPNGSGKSTVTRAFIAHNSLAGEYINADDIVIADGISNEEAARIAENRREQALKEGRDFTFETVMSTDRNLKLLRRAKKKGYFIKCFYVITSDPSINVERVSDRVASGGHNVSATKIRKRYKRALALMQDVIKVSDVAHVYDNTLEEPQRIFKKKKDEIIVFGNDAWSKVDVCEMVGATNIVGKKQPIEQEYCAYIPSPRTGDIWVRPHPWKGTHRRAFWRRRPK